MDLGRLLAPRPVEDILAGQVRVRLDGVEYILPVRPMRANAIWEEALDLELVRLLMVVREDGDDVVGVLRALAATPGRFIDLLLSYDDQSVLPDRQTVYETNTEIVLLIAVLEVWRAAHPLVDIGIETFATTGLPANALPGLTSSLWPNGATASEPSGMN